MKIRLIAVLLIASLSFSLEAQDLQSRFETELKTKTEGVTKITSHYVQTRYMTVLRDTPKLPGNFTFLAPSTLSLDFDNGDYIHIGQKDFEMKTGNNVSKTSVNSNPMLKKLGTILTACITGDYGKLTEGFNSTLSFDSGEWILSLTPKKGKGAVRISEILMVFDDKDMSLKELKMAESGGNYTQYHFTGTRYETGR